MLLKLNKKEWVDFINRFSFRAFRKDHKVIIDELSSIVVKVIKKNIPNSKFGVLFSGGVDSTTIAQVCKNLGNDFICYTAALSEKSMTEAEDLIYSKKVAKKLGFKLKVKTINVDETERYIKKILKIIKEPNVVKVGVALPFYIAYEMALKDNVKIMFSGLGSEEVFAGYERHLKAKRVNKECFNGLLAMYDRDLTRDLKVAKALGIKLKVPFLEKDLIGYGLKIPAKYKLSKEQNKIILREVAFELGLGEFAWRKKRAAQYGSKFDRAILKLTKKKGFKYKKDYLESLL